MYCRTRSEVITRSDAKGSDANRVRASGASSMFAEQADPVCAGEVRHPAGDVGPQRPVGEGCPQLGHGGVDVAVEAVLMKDVLQGPAAQRGEGLPPHTLALQPLVLPVPRPV